MEDIIAKIQAALLKGEAQEVKEKTEEALKIGIRPKKIISQGLQPGMKIVGQKFRENEYFIPEVLMASRAMHAAYYVMRPLLTKSKLSNKGRIVIGTVAGDLHDIGKNLIVMMLEGAGYEVIDIGIDVPETDFVQAIKQYQPDILGLTALLTTTMGEIRNVITALKEEGVRDQVKIMVGGEPVTPEFAVAVGADAYAVDFDHALQAVKRLMAGEVGFIAAL